MWFLSQVPVYEPTNIAFLMVFRPLGERSKQQSKLVSPFSYRHKYAKHEQEYLGMRMIVTAK